MQYKDNPAAAAYVAMYEKKVTERASWVPEEITDEGAAEFMGAAANAAKKGDKTFKFGDKEYKVTMKKDTVDAITKNESMVTEAKKLKDTDLVSRVGGGMGQLDVSAHIRKALKVKDAYFDGADLVVGDKTAVPGALKDPRMTIKDLVSAAAKKLGIKEVAEPEAKGEKAFKDMHTDNTKKSGEKDDGTVVKESSEEAEIDEASKFTASGLGKAIIKDTQSALSVTKRNLDVSLKELTKAQEKIQAGFNDGSAPAVEKGFSLPQITKTINDLIKVIDGASKNAKRMEMKEESDDIQERAVKVKPERFKGNRSEQAAANALTKAGYVYGRTPDMLAFETPGFFNPKNGNKVSLMNGGKKFAVSRSDGSTLQGPIAVSYLDQWLIKNK